MSQRKIKKLDIKEEGVIIKVSYRPIIDKIELNGLTIKVTPISPDELNREFTQNNLRDGKFNYSHYEKSKESYFLKKKRGNREKTDLEFLLDGIEWLGDNDQITEEESDLLNRMIIGHYIPDYKAPSDNEGAINSNPYLIGISYMNLYKIELKNSTNTPVKFNESFIIRSGTSTLENLSTQFLREGLEQVGEMNLNKKLTLERFNLQTPLQLLPNSTTVKYFAALPFDLTSDKFEIGVTSSNQLMSWEAQIIRNDIDKKFSFFEFPLSFADKYDVELYGSTFSILSQSGEGQAYLTGERLFINSDEVKIPLEIITLCLSNDNIYFGRMKNIIGSDHLDLVKNRRTKVVVKTEKLAEVKRRVK